jgi:excisionase family DNA binding protein
LLPRYLTASAQSTLPSLPSGSRHTCRPPRSPEQGGWLTTKQAADYLGLTTRAIHHYTAAQAIPFEQDTPGGKCWFLKSELDGWRRGEHASKPLT